MNILPKKRWHVRTKDNIARVRKDEAEAAEKQRRIQNQINKAEQEARIKYLRNNCDSKTGHPPVANETEVDFLNIIDSSSYPNKEYEKEKKMEKEKYEKQIGYLTYVGQHRNQPNLKRWYEVAPDRRIDKKIRIEDNVIDQKYDSLKTCNKSEKKETVTKIPKEMFKTICKSRNDKNSLLELRKKRLIREANERKREKKILNK